MLGLTNYVIVIVINALDDYEKKQTDWFNQVPTIRLAALRSIYSDTIGNQHIRSDIQKQAYNFDSVKTIRQAYGITGTKFDTHTPFKNGVQLSIDDNVKRKDEIVLIRNNLDVIRALKMTQNHRLLPDHLGS